MSEHVRGILDDPPSHRAMQPERRKLLPSQPRPEIGHSQERIDGVPLDSPMLPNPHVRQLSALAQVHDMLSRRPQEDCDFPG